MLPCGGGSSRRRRRAGAFGRLVDGVDDRLADALDLVLAEPGRCEQLLGAGLSAAENCRGLRARPLERLLDLGAGRVGQLGRLVARLLEQAVALRLGLAKLLRRVAVRVREQLARLIAGGVQHLGALALALLAVALDLRLAILLLAPATAYFFFGLGELRLGCLLCVGLDRVRELGGGPDQMQRVHAHGVPGGLDGLPAPACGLQHAKLRLKLGGVPPE